MKKNRQLQYEDGSLTVEGMKASKYGIVWHRPDDFTSLEPKPWEYPFWHLGMSINEFNIAKENWINENKRKFYGRACV